MKDFFFELHLWHFIYLKTLYTNIKRLFFFIINNRVCMFQLHHLVICSKVIFKVWIRKLTTDEQN